MNGQVVVVAPHSDDECLGAGGTIALLSRRGILVTVVTVGSELPPLFPPATRDVVQQEARRCHELLGVAESVFLDIPSVGISRVSTARLNHAIQAVIDRVRPRIVFVPFPDRHVDHRAVFDAAVVATRPYRSSRCVRVVAMYEVISETFWNVPGAEPTFTPAWTVDISETIETKIEAFDAYRSRITAFPGPRSAEALRALATFRGSQQSMPYGEAFALVRASFSPLSVLRGPGTASASGCERPIDPTPVAVRPYPREESEQR
ncbi:PIG-L deacetylase family protein [Phytoactinopolyspora halotolerans]|uniref:PIG-L family deacetylase n=1 Tax=Phytoactinopolyspora halotolerans TaxID=1981512 RepID=A0A6L9S539_9ACTN|nr:PIG-L deacetylase family protein [Phytoactinopolyspora halotolerans]NED99850.1 PIG-L family deacetylase [Phytoactinopolyspora halotolerans]